MAKSAWQHSYSGPRAREPCVKSRDPLSLPVLCSGLSHGPRCLPRWSDGGTVSKPAKGRVGATLFRSQHPAPWFCGWKSGSELFAAVGEPPASCACLLTLSVQGHVVKQPDEASLAVGSWTTDLHLPSAASHVQPHPSVRPGGDARRTHLVLAPDK